MAFVSHSPPVAGSSARCHAAPLELGGPGGICGYKHGAPKGAFCLVAVTSPPSEAQGTSAFGRMLSRRRSVPLAKPLWEPLKTRGPARWELNPQQLLNSEAIEVGTAIRGGGVAEVVGARSSIQIDLQVGESGEQIGGPLDGVVGEVTLDQRSATPPSRSGPALRKAKWLWASFGFVPTLYSAKSDMPSPSESPVPVRERLPK